jgi:hypothetical protein
MFVCSDCYVCFVLGFLFHCCSVYCLNVNVYCSLLLSLRHNPLAVNKYIVSHYSVVGIAIGYGLDGPGIESR